MLYSNYTPHRDDSHNPRLVLYVCICVSIFFFCWVTSLQPILSIYILYLIPEEKIGNEGHPDAGLFGELEVLADGNHEL